MSSIKWPSRYTGLACKMHKTLIQMVASMAKLEKFDVKIANDLGHHGFHLTIDVRHGIEKPIKQAGR